MNKLMKKYRQIKQKKEGFTLVELIVVLVILAILAAILVPALLGWIDKAKEKQIVVNARTAYLAAQTYGSEQYAKNKGSVTISDFYCYDDTKTGDQRTAVNAVMELADLKKSTQTVKFKIENGKVTEFAYKEGTLTATLDLKGGADGWTVK